MKSPTHKELKKLEKQMGNTKIKHNRPPVGRPCFFFGKTNKQSRREGRMTAKFYTE